MRFINSRAPIKGDSNTLNVSTSPTCSIRACIKLDIKKSGIICTSTVVSPSWRKISAMRLSAFIGKAIYKTSISPLRAASTACWIRPATSCLVEFSKRRSGCLSSKKPKNLKPSSSFLFISSYKLTADSVAPTIATLRKFSPSFLLFLLNKYTPRRQVYKKTILSKNHSPKPIRESESVNLKVKDIKSKTAKAISKAPQAQSTIVLNFPARQER